MYVSALIVADLTTYYNNRYIFHQPYTDPIVKLSDEIVRINFFF